MMVRSIPLLLLLFSTPSHKKKLIQKFPHFTTTDIERLPDSAQAEYNNPDGISGTSSTGAWDGRGPEPAKKDRVGNNVGNTNHRSGFSPWSNEVDVTEVEGGPSTLEEYDEEERARGNGSSGKNGGGRKADPLDNEEFYATTSQTQSTNNGDVGGPSSSGRGKKSKGKGIKGFLSHRDRYENQGPETISSSTNGNGGDRFDKMNASRNGNGINEAGASGGDEYADEFERELNTGSKVSKGNEFRNSSDGRFDTFDNDPLSVSNVPVKTTSNSDRMYFFLY